MPRRAWRERVEDILQAVERIRSYTESLNARSFAEDQKTIDAVVRNLEVIGEASSHIPLEIQGRHSEIPWREMRAMRNLLSHAYFGIDAAVVWKTVRDDLPALAAGLKSVLDEDRH